MAPSRNSSSCGGLDLDASALRRVSCASSHKYDSTAADRILSDRRKLSSLVRALLSTNRIRPEQI